MTALWKPRFTINVKTNPRPVVGIKLCHNVKISVIPFTTIN